MSIERRLAFKYLIYSDPNSKKLKISFQLIFAILSVSLGTLTLLLTFTILNGFENEIESKIQKLSSHIQISFYENSSISGNKNILEAIEPVKNDIKAITYESKKEGILYFKNTVEGVILKGIEPYFETNILSNYLIQNSETEYKNLSNSRNIIIGKKLKSKMNLQIGDTISFSTLQSDLGISEILSTNFVISGFYETGMSEYDDIFCYINLSMFQNIYNLGESFDVVNIYLNDPKNSSTISEKIKKNIPKYYSVIEYKELYRNLFSWIQLQKGPTPVILGLIMIVGVFNIIGSQLLILLKRISNLGVLRAIGLNKKSIQKIFILQGLFIGIIGVIIGNIIALTFSFLQLKFELISLPSDIYLMNKVPILIQWEYYLVVSLVTILFSIIAAFIPARISTKLQIHDSLKYT